jgi:hypothetical protein
MDFLSFIPAILNTISTVVTRLVPDAGQAAQLQFELQKALLDSQDAMNKSIADAMQAQTAVNAKEAESPSIFVSGWRPFIGWVCGIGVAYAFLFNPFLTWVASMAGVVSPPTLDTTQMTGLLMGLLGLGTLRTVEKVQGVANVTITPPSAHVSKGK